VPKTKEIRNLSLIGYNELFASTAEPSGAAVTSDTYGERIVEITLSELYPPEFHPFNVNDDEAMDRLTENIRQYGVREPGLARPREDGGYELVAGNRRKRACELAGLPTMPVIVRDMDDADAAIAMVELNLEQRETLLYSEKAWAYKVKMDALNHNGIKGDKHSYEILMEQTGESKNQIFRLIRLTELIVGLLDMVDARKIAFNPAVALSYLSQTEQTAVISSIEQHGIKPSLSQASRIKDLKQNGDLTIEMIDEILSESKKPENDNEDKEISRFRKYFPDGYTAEQMNIVILDLLQEWQQRQADIGLVKSA
jgi:ParB family chromosome partitioning protein